MTKEMEELIKPHSLIMMLLVFCLMMASGKGFPFGNQLLAYAGLVLIFRLPVPLAWLSSGFVVVIKTIVVALFLNS